MAQRKFASDIRNAFEYSQHARSKAKGNGPLALASGGNVPPKAANQLHALLDLRGKKRFHLDTDSPHKNFHILSLSTFKTIPIDQLLAPPSTNLDWDSEPNQLTLL